MNKRAINTGFAPSFIDETVEKESLRACEWPSCENNAEHKANRSPRHMSDYVWYCVDHAREHNKSWNFFEGLSEDEVESEIRNDTVWQRPTWKLGSGPAAHKARFDPDGIKIKDDFGIFDEVTGGNAGGKKNSGFEEKPRHDTKLMHSYALLDIDPPSNKEEIKNKYKKLVKLHHPDTNNGKKEAEEKFKDISEAYQLIMVALDEYLL